MKYGILAAALCVSTTAWGQPSGKPAAEWDFGASIGQVAIDSSAATEARIEDSALGIDLFATYRQANWLGTAGIQLLTYDDQDAFRVRVRNNFGRTSNEDSQATGVLVHVAYGPLWDLQQNNRVKGFVQGGFAMMASSERSVDFCDNCPEEDIDINGGVFGRAGVMYNFDRFAVCTSYTQYISGDLNSSLMLSVSTSYN